MAWSESIIQLQHLRVLTVLVLQQQLLARCSCCMQILLTQNTDALHLVLHLVLQLPLCTI